MLLGRLDGLVGRRRQPRRVRERCRDLLLDAESELACAGCRVDGVNAEAFRHGQLALEAAHHELREAPLLRLRRQRLELGAARGLQSNRAAAARQRERALEVLRELHGGPHEVLVLRVVLADQVVITGVGDGDADVVVPLARIRRAALEPVARQRPAELHERLALDRREQLAEVALPRAPPARRAARWAGARAATANGAAPARDWRARGDRDRRGAGAAGWRGRRASGAASGAARPLPVVGSRRRRRRRGVVSSSFRRRGVRRSSSSAGAGAGRGDGRRRRGGRRRAATGVTGATLLAGVAGAALAAAARAAFSLTKALRKRLHESGLSVLALHSRSRSSTDVAKSSGTSLAMARTRSRTGPWHWTSSSHAVSSAEGRGPTAGGGGRRAGRAPAGGGGSSAAGRAAAPRGAAAAARREVPRRRVGALGDDRRLDVVQVAALGAGVLERGPQVPREVVAQVLHVLFIVDAEVLEDRGVLLPVARLDLVEPRGDVFRRGPRQRRRRRS